LSINTYDLPWWTGDDDDVKRRLAAFVFNRISMSFTSAILCVCACMYVSFKLSSYKVVMLVAFSLLFFCLQVAADQFCFTLPLPSPFSLVMFCSSSLVMRKRKSPSRRRDRGWLYALSLFLVPKYTCPACMYVCTRIWMNRKEEGSSFALLSHIHIDDGSTWQTSLLNFLLRHRLRSHAVRARMHHIIYSQRKKKRIWFKFLYVCTMFFFFLFSKEEKEKFLFCRWILRHQIEE
jgi:hypothetical protein